MSEQNIHVQQNQGELVYDHIAKVRHLVWSLRESLSVRFFVYLEKRFFILIWLFYCRICIRLRLKILITTRAWIVECKYGEHG